MKEKEIPKNNYEKALLEYLKELTKDYLEENRVLF